VQLAALKTEIRNMDWSRWHSAKTSHSRSGDFWFFFQSGPGCIEWCMEWCFQY